MDAATAKTELLENTFRHSLQQLCTHFADQGNTEGLLDLRRLTDDAVGRAVQRVRATAGKGFHSCDGREAAYD